MPRYTVHHAGVNIYDGIHGYPVPGYVIRDNANHRLLLLVYPAAAAARDAAELNAADAARQNPTDSQVCPA